jgi:hypothetical protein
MSTAVWMVGAGVDYTKFDATSKRTGVYFEWSFNQRAQQSGYTSPPTWYGGVGGCTGMSHTQFNYDIGACAAVVGIVPPGAPENFANQVLFNIPTSFVFDDTYGAHWQAAIKLTMPDPFWQEPFKPDCGVFLPDVFNWIEDDGSNNGGAGDEDGTTDDGHSIKTHFFRHHPLVEALSAIPSGDGLPDGITLLLDPSQHTILPPFYNDSGRYGIPIGDGEGNYANVETDWGFAGRVCAAHTRFSGFYATFVKC